MRRWLFALALLGAVPAYAEPLAPAPTSSSTPSLDAEELELLRYLAVLEHLELLEDWDLLELWPLLAEEEEQ